MCEDSRGERRYWVQRVEQLRKQMEQEDVERQDRMAQAGRGATGSIRPEPLPAGKSGWRLGSLVAGTVVALSILLFSTMSAAATFVYVSNAEDGDIGMYTLQPDGSLKPGPRFKAEKVVMPMTVSPDRRFLVAAVRSKPFSAYDANGGLKTIGRYPTGKGSNWVEIVAFD